MDDIKSDSVDGNESPPEERLLTPDDLLADIRKGEPDYVPEKTNIFRINQAFLSYNDIVPIAFGDIKSITPDPIEYIFHPCLPTQGIAFIYAATGVGKTLFALNLAYAIAQGGNFLKYAVPKPRKVLYIDGEMAYNQIHARLMQIKLHQGDLDDDNNFNLLTPDKVYPFRMPKIDCPAGQDIYDQIFDKYKYDVIVIDNLSMLSTFDENKSNEWIAIQDWLLKHRAQGRSFIIVHHAGKEKMGYRGTSRMIDCADMAISLQPVAEADLEQDKVVGKKFKVVYQKARIFGGNEALPYEVTLERGIWSFKSLEQTEMERIVEMVGLKMNQRDIAKEMIISLGKTNKLIKKARQLGLIRD